MILKEQNYSSNQDMLEKQFTTDHTKTQEYMKIKGDQPEKKATNINGVKSANKESDPIVHPMERPSTRRVKRLGNIPIVTPDC